MNIFFAASLVPFLSPLPFMYSISFGSPQQHAATRTSFVLRSTSFRFHFGLREIHMGRTRAAVSGLRTGQFWKLNRLQLPRYEIAPPFPSSSLLPPANEYIG